MKVQTGYLYHIKDEFFEHLNDMGLMLNHEHGKARPTYFVIKDKDLLWFIPLSSKVNKYKNIINKKIKKYGKCKSIMIRKITGVDCAILIQNAFPTIEKFISHPHTRNKVPVKVGTLLEDEILNNFKTLLALKNGGNDLFFTDIDRIKEEMLKELEKEKVTS